MQFNILSPSFFIRMFKKNLLVFSYLFSIGLYAQKKETLEWLNTNSIAIEDVNPTTELVIFKQREPQKFTNAKIYGFGEASHNTKEFFDLKAKFFKYLVVNHGLRVFIMEESYQAESGINEWISGGKGDIKTIANNFKTGFWYTQEIVNLLKWMRDYNIGKPLDAQIRFYGMDPKSGVLINLELRKFVTDNKISIDENLLKSIDSCANKSIDFSKKDAWWQKQIPKLNEFKQLLAQSKKEQLEVRKAIRSINYLISYVEYAALVGEKYPTGTQFRDLKMFENVKYIIENESENGKAFLWAHNEHISNTEMYYSGSNIINLGRHLKDYFKEDYYSVGFDFGTGKINGYVIDEKKGNYWKTYTIEAPFSGTYAKTLMSVDKNIYFIDLENAIQNEPSDFFEKEAKQLLIAAGGYQPNPLHKILVRKIYSETYDGLLFVKSISIPNYKLDE